MGVGSHRGTLVVALERPWSGHSLPSELEGSGFRLSIPGGGRGARTAEAWGPSHVALCPQCAPVPMGWPAQLGASVATSNAWGAAAGRTTPVPVSPAATSTSGAPATRPALPAPTSTSPGAASRPSAAPACTLCPAAPPPLASTRAAASPSALQASPGTAAGECGAGGVTLGHRGGPQGALATPSACPCQHILPQV